MITLFAFLLLFWLICCVIIEAGEILLTIVGIVIAVAVIFAIINAIKEKLDSLNKEKNDSQNKE